MEEFDKFKDNLNNDYTDIEDGNYKENNELENIPVLEVKEIERNNKILHNAISHYKKIIEKKNIIIDMLVKEDEEMKFLHNMIKEYENTIEEPIANNLPKNVEEITEELESLFENKCGCKKYPINEE